MFLSLTVPELIISHEIEFTETVRAFLMSDCYEWFDAEQGSI